MSAGAPIKGRARTEPLGERELGAWRGLLRVHAELTGRLDAELRERHDLALSAYEVLMLLGDASEGRMRISELGEATILSVSGVSRLVDRLAGAGLVEKRACAEDARGAFAVITPRGRRRLRAARATHLAQVRELFLSRFSADELETLAAYWERVVPGAASADV